MEAIPYFKPSIGREEVEEVVDTLNNGWLTTGPKTKRFEEAFAEYMGRRHAVAVSSCTAALHLALEAVGVKPGEAVVVPAMTFAATAEVVRYFDAHCILVDCRGHDLNMDMNDAEKKIQAAIKRGETVRVIIPVHYGGQIGDVEGVRRLAGKFGLTVVEDAAHCCPAGFRSSPSKPWEPVGSIGKIAAFSFYANKTITTGEGGMVCTDDDGLADRIRLMSLHGISRDAVNRYHLQGNWQYEIVAPGFKYNLTDIASSIGIHQLKKADAFHKRREELAMLYYELLGDVDEIVLPEISENRRHSWHLFSIGLRLERLTIDRGAVIEHLRGRGIGTSVHWMPLHMHPYYRKSGAYPEDDLPVSTAVYPRILSLPLYPGLSDRQLRLVAEAVKDTIVNHQRRKPRMEMAGKG